MAKILLVEDEAALRETILLALQGEGHTIIEAADGNEALEALARDTVDLVLTDIMMPNREGMETIAQIRKSFPVLPILAMSGGGKQGWYDVLRMATNIGADDTIAKPFTISALLERVARLLGH